MIGRGAAEHTVTDVPFIRLETRPVVVDIATLDLVRRGRRAPEKPFRHLGNKRVLE